MLLLGESRSERAELPMRRRVLDRDAGKDRLECPRRSLVSGTGRGTESPDIQLKMGNGATRGMSCPVVYTAPQGSAKP